MTTTNKQAVTGFQVLTFQVKKTKDTEKVKLVLEADVDCVGAGSKDMGDILKAFLHHQVGNIDIGISVFVSDALILDEEDN